jgi:succinate dehydrogenase / fumarate reductase cytochrome b subunit
MNSEKQSRPLSPHLSIYKPQITSLLSITHRMTGVFLYVGIIMLTWWLIIGVYSGFNPNVARWDFFTTNTFGRLLVLAWSIAIFYHLLNGIRHLFWDAGKGFEIKTATRSGIFVIIGTIALTVLSWGIAFND